MEQSLKITKGQKSHLKMIINELKVQFEQLIQDTKGQKVEIDAFYKKLLVSSENNPSLQDEIVQIKTTLDGVLQEQKNTLSEIEEFYNEIFVGNEEDEVSSKKEEIEDFFKTIDQDLKKIEKNRLQIENYFDDLFGKKDENGVYSGGLKQELENKRAEYEELNKKIESLLPGATSAGLAYAYEKQRTTYKEPQWIRSFVFGLSIIAMIIILFYYKLDLGELPDSLGSFFLRFLFRLAIASPLVWLASFASKQQSKLQRLEQEYAYKEALSRSFDGYNREIRRLEKNEKTEALLIELLQNVVDMSGYNPSVTLDNLSHETKNPISGTIEDLAKQVATILPNLKL